MAETTVTIPEDVYDALLRLAAARGDDDDRAVVEAWVPGWDR